MVVCVQTDLATATPLTLSVVAMETSPPMATGSQTLAERVGKSTVSSFASLNSVCLCPHHLLHVCSQSFSF